MLPTSIVNMIKIHVPKSFEGILPVSPNDTPFHYEPYAFFGIQSSLSEGSIAFDIGVSYGVMTTLMGKLVGESGRVHSFEANPNVVPFEKEIVQQNNLEHIVTLNNFLVGNESNIEETFYVIEGFQSVASTKNPEILKSLPATEIRVKTITIDEYCLKKNVIPDFLKLDIEGAEFIALQGMENLLINHTLDIVIETHGRSLDAIGGNLEQMTIFLAEKGYLLFDLIEGEVVSPQIYTERYRDQIGHVYCTKKLENPDFERKLVQSHNEKVKDIRRLEKIRPLLMEARSRIDAQKYDEAVKILEQIEQQIESAEANYLLGFALHMSRNHLFEAIKRYNRALELGFDPFWVYYNRGSLYASIGEKELAKEDLFRAHSLNKNHEGVLHELNKLQNK